MLVSAHLPESWHHDDDYEAALEDISATLRVLKAHEGHILIGVDANAGHTEEDIDEEHFRNEGTQDMPSARNEAWANSVRVNGMRATK